MDGVQILNYSIATQVWIKYVVPYMCSNTKLLKALIDMSYYSYTSPYSK